MYVTLVNVQVMPEHIDDFIAATRDNHLASVREDGNMRFDVLQLPEDPGHFLLYEAYVSREAAASHKETPHYLTWRDSVAGWLASPRSSVVFNGLLPAGEDT